VLTLAAGAGGVFLLVYHQARSNSHAKKIEATKKKNAVGIKFAGTVTATKAGFLIVTTQGKPRRLYTTRVTRVEDATHGSNTDVAVGDRALVRMKAGSPGVVQEILVLPANARFGRVVAKAGFGYMWLRGKNGRVGPKISVVNVMLDHGVRATRNDLKVGTKVLVHAQPTLKPVRLVATEIVLLPSSSVFAR